MRLISTTALIAFLSSIPAVGDTLSVGSANTASGSTLQLPLSFQNSNEIVGMQFDLRFPESQVESGNSVQATTSTNHSAESRELAPGIRRVVLYSSSNQVIPSDLILQVPLTLKAEATPSGGPTVHISNIILTDKFGATFTPTVNRTLLDAWRLTHFNESERREAKMIADDADPDNDGFSNLMEYLTGGDPKAKQANQQLQTNFGEDQTDNHTYLTMTFRAAKNALGGTLVVKGSDDLKQWHTTGIQLTPTGVEDATTIEYEASAQVDSKARYFLKLTGRRTPGQ